MQHEGELGQRDAELRERDPDDGRGPHPGHAAPQQDEVQYSTVQYITVLYSMSYT